jgi:vacuolar protein sorting-associated protein 72
MTPSTGRRTTLCPITGLTAKYLDPATGIPFANARAYRTIQGLVKHRYVWSEAMGCYVGDEERTEGATGVPGGWEEAVVGK